MATVLQLLSLRVEERLLIIHDDLTRAFAADVASVLGDRSTLLDLDAFPRPLEKVSAELRGQALSHDVVLLVIDKAGTPQRTELAFRHELVALVEDAGKRIGTLLGLSSELIREVLSVDPWESAAFTESLLAEVKDASRMRITCPRGTDLEATFSPVHPWLSSTGFIVAGRARNALPSEIFAYPATVSGRLVVAGTYGYLGYRPDLGTPAELLARMAAAPISLEIADGRIVSARGDDEALLAAMLGELDAHPNARRIGEIGIGTNRALKRCTGVMMVDEKLPGVHVAHGHGYPRLTGAPYECPVHHDMVVLEPTVEIDGHLILDGGAFVSTTLKNRA